VRRKKGHEISGKEKDSKAMKKVVVVVVVVVVVIVAPKVEDLPQIKHTNKPFLPLLGVIISSRWPTLMTAGTIH